MKKQHGAKSFGPIDIATKPNVEAWFYWTRTRRSIDIVVHPLQDGKRIPGAGRIVKIQLRKLGK